MAVTYQSPNTGDTLKTMSPNAQRKLWAKGVEMFEQTHDFWQKFEGKSTRSLIRTVNDTTKGKGQKITFTNMSGFYGEGKQGEELFENQDDFENLDIGDYEMTVDWLRNAVRWTARTEEWMGMRGELANNIPAQLGEWLGRTKSDRLFMMFREKGGAENYVYANGRGSLDSLKSADVLNWDEIVGLKTTMSRMGGKPAHMGKTANGEMLFRQCVVATTDSLYSLELDTNFKQVLREAGSRGDTNSLFAGGYTDVRGNVIHEYRPIDHDGYGPIGSAINPKAQLGEAISAGTTTFDIKGGGDATGAARTKILYFKHFPKYAYKFLPDDILDVSEVSNFYVLIINPANAETDPGKIGMYEVSANDGNKLTVAKRLASADSGIADDKVGEVTWNTGVWDGWHTDEHPAGSLVIPCNAYGVPYGHTYMLGASAAYRGYGMYRNRRGTQTHEAGFVSDTFITSVFGQEPRQNRRGICPGFMCLTHAIQYSGIKIPTVT